MSKEIRKINLFFRSAVKHEIEQVKEILAYLATKPYKEVFQLINEIQQVAVQNQKKEG